MQRNLLHCIVFTLEEKLNSCVILHCHLPHWPDNPRDDKNDFVIMVTYAYSTPETRYSKEAFSALTWMSSSIDRQKKDGWRGNAQCASVTAGRSNVATSVSLRNAPR